MKEEFNILMKRFENEQKNNSDLRIISKNLEKEINILMNTKTPKFVINTINKNDIFVFYIINCYKCRLKNLN
jgi:hypothetical protein